MIRLKLRTRRQLRVLNAQEWLDFKKHWPMQVLRLLLDTGCGVLLGIALCLAVFIHIMDFLGRAGS